MQFRVASLILTVFAAFLIIVTKGEAANKSWHPESVAEREIDLAQRFEQKGLKLGSPIFIRVYKQTSEMELWVQHGFRYELFKVYGICRWSGGLGPKYYEGDRQSPEGLYGITTSDLIVNKRWDRAMNINYPNSFDRTNGRGGSSILIHGGCGSIGCFAIQNQNVEDVFGAVRAALRNGQAYIPVLSLPFRFSTLAPEKEDTLQMSEFWSDLRRADLLFARDRLPPVAWICDGRYYFSDRRGDRERHAVHLPGCKPMAKPAGLRDAKSVPQDNKPAITAAAENPEKVAENEPVQNVVEKKPEEAAENKPALKVAEKNPGTPSVKRHVRSVAGKAASTSKKSHIIRAKHSGHALRAKRINS